MFHLSSCSHNRMVNWRTQYRMHKHDNRQVYQLEDNVFYDFASSKSSNPGLGKARDRRHECQSLDRGPANRNLLCESSDHRLTVQDCILRRTRASCSALELTTNVLLVLLASTLAALTVSALQPGPLRTGFVHIEPIALRCG